MLRHFRGYIRYYRRSFCTCDNWFYIQDGMSSTHLDSVRSVSVPATLAYPLERSTHDPGTISRRKNDTEVRNMSPVMLQLDPGYFDELDESRGKRLSFRKDKVDATFPEQRCVATSSKLSYKAIHSRVRNCALKFTTVLRRDNDVKTVLARGGNSLPLLDAHSGKWGRPSETLRSQRSQTNAKYALVALLCRSSCLVNMRTAHAYIASPCSIIQSIIYYHNI